MRLKEVRNAVFVCGRDLDNVSVYGRFSLAEV